MNRVRWLDRRIAAPGPYLALCLNEQQFAAACRHIRCVAPPPFVRNEWSDATAHYFNSPRGQTVIVCLRGWEGRHPIEVAGILVHEAVHVWQEYADRIGETHPGREQEAYAIQAIAQELMDEFAQQMQAMHDSQRSEKD
jgi:hypothetical protein